MLHSPKHSECRRRAFRTFLQTACGMLAAELAAAAAEPAAQTARWKTGLLILFASSVAAGIAAVMNCRSEPS